MDAHDPTNEYLTSLFTDIEKDQNKILKKIQLKEVNYNDDFVWLTFGDLVLPVLKKNIDNPLKTIFVYSNRYEIENIPIVEIQGVEIPLSFKQMLELEHRYSKPYKKYMREYKGNQML